MKNLPKIYVNKNKVWGKITFPHSDFSWSSRSFALTDFPDRLLFVSGQGKKKITGNPHTQSKPLFQGYSSHSLLDTRKPGKSAKFTS